MYRTTMLSYMINSIKTTHVDIEATSDQQVKIKFLTQATIYNNISPYTQTQFIKGTLFKNKKRIDYSLDQYTIDGINQSIKRITGYRNGYFNPYIQKKSPN